LTTVLKAIGPPGSIPFIACCVLLGIVLAYVWPRHGGVARLWLWLVFIAHTILALPVVANTIASGLPRVDGSDPGALRNLDTVFVLDGDNRRGRVRSAAQAASASPGASIVVLGGESWLIDALAEAGVAPTRISYDSQPADTREQMAALRRMTAKTPGKTALVASRLQMPRVAALGRDVGVSFALIASPIDTEPATSGWRLFVPSYYALRVSRDAIYEHAALAYYTRKGWIRPAASLTGRAPARTATPRCRGPVS
jgi:uncharacterized SAM-binding protein YcdF (DUF218 family)